MSWIGDFRLGDTIDHKFTTRQISGQPFSLAGTPVISAFVGTSTVSITTGVSLQTDFAGLTGLNHVRVLATGANGFATLSNYSLVLTAGTVNSVTVRAEIIGAFSIENRSALMPAVGTRSIAITAAGNAGIDWGNVANTTTSVTLSATTFNAANTVGTVGTVTTALTTNTAGTVTVALTANTVGTVGTVSVGLTVNTVGTVGTVTTVLSVTNPVGVTSQVKRNQALGNFEFLMTDSTNHQAATGLTVSVARSVDGGAFAGGTLSGVTEIGSGIYGVDFGAGDLNGKAITLLATAAASDPLYVTVITAP